MASSSIWRRTVVLLLADLEQTASGELVELGGGDGCARDDGHRLRAGDGGGFGRAFRRHPRRRGRNRE